MSNGLFSIDYLNLYGREYYDLQNKVINQTLEDVRSSKIVAEAFEEEEKEAIVFFRQTKSAAEAEQIINGLYYDYTKDLALHNTPPDFRPTALNTARSKLSQQEGNLRNWQLVFCTLAEIKKLQKQNPKAAKIIDGFFFVDTYVYADFALEHTLDSVIRLDVAAWAFYRLPHLEKKLKDKGALFSKRFDIDSEFWFVPSAYKDCIEEFTEFNNNSVSEYIDALESPAENQLCEKVEAAGYLPSETASMYFGNKWHRFPRSVLATYSYLVMMSKGKFYKENQYINLSNSQIAKAIGYSKRSVTRAITILSKDEIYLSPEDSLINKPITEEEKAKYKNSVNIEADVEEARIKTVKRKGGLGLIKTYMANNEKGHRERRIGLLDLEDVVNKELQIPTFKMQGLGKTAALFASLLTYANANKIAYFNRTQIKRAHLKIIGARLGLYGSYLNKIIKELVQKQILVIIEDAIYFKEDFINQYFNTYKAYITHLLKKPVKSISDRISENQELVKDRRHWLYKTPYY